MPRSASCKASSNNTPLFPEPAGPCKTRICCWPGASSTQGSPAFQTGESGVPQPVDDPAILEGAPQHLDQRRQPGIPAQFARRVAFVSQVFGHLLRINPPAEITLGLREAAQRRR